MHNRQSITPILFAVFLSLSLTPHLLGSGDALPTKTPAPTNAAPTSVSPPPPARPSLPATTERPTTYTVVSGDTLWDLSHKFNCSVSQLKTLNKLKKNALKPGQVLQIPPAKSEKPVTPAAKPTASVKPATSAPMPQFKAASHSATYLRAQPVQDFDVPASTFASCPEPPSSSESESETSATGSPAPEPTGAETSSPPT
ncbi:MAG TPA: LysM peptidoglycan-binding domain-containing protein, partial [Candidatus Methylacidiphilales bacterium]